MNHDESQAEAEQPRPLMALPGRTTDEGPLFHRYLAEVLDLIGGHLPAMLGPTDRDIYEWEHSARAAVVSAVSELTCWPEDLFDAMMRAIAHDPDPSFNCQLINPALTLAGHRRVQLALLDLLSSGTNAEKAGAARAWYWARILRRGESAESVNARVCTEESEWEQGIVKDLRIRWRQTALRTFISHEDLDVRRCILPGLSLNPAHYSEDLSDLVAQAVHIARNHPDEYIRHRVEHQV